MMKLRIAAYAILLAAAMPACKKSNTEPTNNQPPPTGTRLQLSLDSLYLYAKETYLWYDALPDYNTFNPRSYAGSDEFTSLQAELYKITQYKINPETSKPYEYVENSSHAKYSFLEKGNAAQGIKGTVDLEGQGNDFGLGFTIIDGVTDQLYVRLVEKGSPAATATITRGCQVTAVNGVPMVTASAVNAAMAANTIQLTLKRPVTGEVFSATLTKSTYTNDPVYTWKTFTDGAKITGYINLARFSRLSNAQPSLDKAFAEFATKKVNNLVIDLRYNGGGYVSTFEYLANLIGPSSLNGKVMYKEIFNKLLQEDNAPILKTIPYLDANNQQVVQNGKKLTYADVDYSVQGNTNYFSKKGSLGAITNVVFIVSSGTASASELAINSLKPYVNVVLVGSSERTYGKPVGFFGIGIDKFTVYMSQFSSVNANNEGNYFAGFQRDISSADDVTRDFGDPQENGLAKALAYINTGAMRTVDDRIMVNGKVMNSSEITTQNVGAEGFNGMIEERRRLKQ
jgi:C-terminal processing protease CtpA/Prc